MGVSALLPLTPALAQLPRLFSEESRHPASSFQDSKSGTTWGIGSPPPNLRQTEAKASLNKDPEAHSVSSAFLPLYWEVGDGVLTNGVWKGFFKVNALKQEVWNFSKSSRRSDIVKFLDPLNSWVKQDCEAIFAGSSGSNFSREQGMNLEARFSPCPSARLVPYVRLGSKLGKSLVVEPAFTKGICSGLCPAPGAQRRCE